MQLPPTKYPPPVQFTLREVLSDLINEVLPRVLAILLLILFTIAGGYP